MDTPAHQTASATTPNTHNEGEAELSPIEQEVLDEYAKLVGKLDDVSDPNRPILSNTVHTTSYVQS